MAKLNISAFARHAGVCRSAIYKAIDRGRIKLGKDKKFDTKHELNAAYLAAHNAGKSKLGPGSAKPKPRPRKTAPGTKKKSSIRATAKKTSRKSKKSDTASKPSSKGKEKGRAAKPKAKQARAGSGRSPDSEPIQTDLLDPRAQAELDKVRAQTRKYRTDTDKVRQALIDRDLVRAIFGKLIAIDTNELLTLGSNIAPDVAGICGKESAKIILKIQKFIDNRCYRVLKNRVRKMNDFLDQVEADNLEDIDDDELAE